MSFKEINFSFENKCYIVRATNHDNDGQQSNGGGKTSFIDIIGVLLLGYSLTGRNVKDCVNWSSDDSKFTVSGLLSNPVHNLECYIERTIYTGSKSQELVLLVNGQTPITLPTKKGVQGGVDVRLGNAYILSDILNIDESDLLNYYLISRSHYTPFLSANTDRKLEVIARFSKADVVDRAIKTLEIQKETIVDGIDEYNLEISNINGYIQALNDQLKQDLEEQFNQQKHQRLDKYYREQQQLQTRLLSIDDEINALNDKKKQFDIPRIDESYLEMLREELDRDEDKLIQTENDLNKHLHVQTHIKNYLAGLISCPQCDHKFSLSGEKFTQNDLSIVDKHIDDLTVVKVAIKESIDNFEQEIKKEESKLNEINRITRELTHIDREIELQQKSQVRILGDLEHLEAQIKSTEQSSYQDEKKHIQDQIDEKKGELSAQEDQLTQVKNDLAKTDEWINHFNDFKFFLGNKPIETICVLVNEYLKLNGSDLNLYIEGVKKLRSGELRQALTPVIYRNWTNPQQFAQFSEGERVRLNLSVDLAFQHLINASSKYGGLNLYLNDELASGLDSLGVKNAATAFNQLNKTILLVTHSGADMVYDNTIEIEKKDGVSVIK